VGEVLFFAVPAKNMQKRGDPVGLPTARVPCASRDLECSPNSQQLSRQQLANPARQTGSLAVQHRCDARWRQTGVKQESKVDVLQKCDETLRQPEA